MAKYNNFDAFIKAHLGKAMDYDGVAGCQCIDLCKYYLKEVFGLESGAWGDAHCWYENFNNIPTLKNNFTRIANTPSFVPKKGDIMVWSGKLSASGHGHVALCDGVGDTTYFYSYDNNWTGNHDATARIKHNYNAVLGVLRPKDQAKVKGEEKKEEKKETTTPTKSVTYMVADISYAQSKVDYAKFAKSIDKVIVRIGYRGYGSAGTLCKDDMFDTHMKGIIKNKIPYGFYFFSQAKNATEGKEEADYCYKIIKDYDPDLPIYFDSELSTEGSGNGRADKISKANRTDAAVAFCKEIEAKGFNAGVYASTSWYNDKLDMSKIKKYSIWVADYGVNNGHANKKPSITPCNAWQFTSKYKVDGISTGIDMSYFYETIPTNGVKPLNPITYKTYYVNDKTGVNYRKAPNGDLAGTYKYGAAISVQVGSDTKKAGYTWVKTKEKFWVAKEFLSTTQPKIVTEVYGVNNSYTLQVDLKVRSGPSTSYTQKNTSQLSATDKKNCYNQTKAVLKKGTKIKVLEVKKINSKNIFIRCSCGWLCAINNGTVYIK